MSPDDSKGEKHEQKLEPQPAKVLELLERLGTGERLVDAPLAMGLSQEDARAIFAEAAVIIRQSLQDASTEKRWPVGGSLLDWQEMTVAEALEILANRVLKPDTEKS